MQEIMIKKTEQDKKADVYTTEDLIVICGIILEKRKAQTQKTFSEEEMTMLTALLFDLPDEFRVWFIRKGDEEAIREFTRHREAQRTGVPLKASSRYLRKMRFVREYVACSFNGAEAARRCGYSRKYAKQVAYRIRRSVPLY